MLKILFCFSVRAWVDSLSHAAYHHGCAIFRKLLWPDGGHEGWGLGSGEAGSLRPKGKILVGDLRKSFTALSNFLSKLFKIPK